jgi:hypothetical protein
MGEWLSLSLLENGSAPRKNRELPAPGLFRPAPILFIIK